MTDIPFFTGHVNMQSDLPIEEVGKEVSKILFGGLEFGGKELEICEEVPAIFIQSAILGLQVILQGTSGFDKINGYYLSITPLDNIVSDKKRSKFGLENYLYELLKVGLFETPDILVLR